MAKQPLRRRMGGMEMALGATGQVLEARQQSEGRQAQSDLRHTMAPRTRDEAQLL